MNELFDKLIIRFTFTAIVVITLFLYKHAHRLFYSRTQGPVIQKFFPSQNAADSFHLFSRILGIGIIFSELYFNMENGFFMASIDFLIVAISTFIIYLGSLYVIESIVLYNFEYSDEVIKKNNLPYSIICFSHALGIAFNLKIIIRVASESLMILLFLWPLTMVLLGLASKTYSFISKLKFENLLINKNMGVSISYMGFFLGCSLVVASSLNNELTEIRAYTIQVVLKLLLSAIILPIFLYGLKYLFNLKDHISIIDNAGDKETGDVDVNFGLHEGANFFTSCLLTVVVTGQIYFGSFYPSF